MSSCTATKHGTPTAYQAYGCRCDDAKLAQFRYRKRLRQDQERGIARMVDATGTRRRLQALLVNGWSSRDLMRRLGYSDGGVWLLYADRLNVTTVNRVKALYDELWDTPGTSKWTKTWATNRGYLPPMAWDDDTIDLLKIVPNLHQEEEEVFAVLDEVAIERFIGNDLDWTTLSTEERVEAGVLMQARGHSRKEIHERCHVNQQRLQAALNAAGPESVRDDRDDAAMEEAS